jgi:hypothetical protein
MERSESFHGQCCSAALREVMKGDEDAESVAGVGIALSATGARGAYCVTVCCASGSALEGCAVLMGGIVAMSIILERMELLRKAKGRSDERFL